MDLATVGVFIGFAGAGWVFGNYDGDPDPRGRRGVVTFAPAFLLVVVGFVLFIVESRRSNPTISPAETWIVPLIGAAVGFLAGRLFGPALEGPR